jgi:hypothetical protein
MSYDQPFSKEVYVLPSAAWGGASDTLKIQGPKGRKGLVKDIRSYVTVNMAGTTTVPEVTVGSAASTPGSLFNEYARHRLGTTAVAGNTAAGTPYRARNLALNAPGYTGSTKPALSDFPGHVQLETNPIPADTPAFISRVAGAGTPAGTGSTEVEVWWD